MSRSRRNRAVAQPKAHALAFAALGHPARLALVARLSAGERCSISTLTSGSRLTRQAVTKHLRVLESAGIVRSAPAGRESLFEYNPQPIAELSGYLKQVSAQWDGALARLKSFVER
jgi:DNA-binding transcriptional ArsR family regulator